MIAIIDYGMGNIHSVKKALEVFGARTVVTNKKEEIEECQKLVLPGVGAFGDAMGELERQGLIGVIKDQIGAGKPFIGICLGLQLLFQTSQESAGVSGLGVIEGAVNRLPADGHKVPHMGWNRIKSSSGACPLLRGISVDPYVYFCHSFYVCPADPKVIAATAEYGKEITSVIWKDNVYGVQFHPEKSQETGLKIIDNFVHLC